MINIILTEDQKKRSVALSNHRVYDKSIRGNDANLVGAYGEIIVYDYLKSLNLEPKLVRQTTHDIIVNQYTIEVKTKERTVPPKGYYDCTVPAYNHDHQKPDFFIFVSLLKIGSGQLRFNEAWILGKISYKRLCKISRFWKSGDIDESNNWRATIDCWNVPVKLLTNLKSSEND